MKKLAGTNWLKLIILLPVAALFLAACTTPDGNPEDGKRWYMMHNCFACHGQNGDDGKAPEIRGTGISYRSFHGTVRNANSPIMKKFPESVISEQDVADIYAWLNVK